MPEPLDERQNLVEEKKNRDGFNRNKIPDSKQPITPPGNKWKRKNLTLFLAMVVVAITLVQLLDHQNPVEEKTYSEFSDILADTSLDIVGIEMQRIGEGYLLVGERKLTPQEQADRREKHQQERPRVPGLPLVQRRQAGAHEPVRLGVERLEPGRDALELRPRRVERGAG